MNASAFPFRSASQKADQLAERLGLPKVAGTDAHYGPVIGRTFTLIDAEPNVEAVVKAIAKGLCQPYGKPISMLMRIENQGRFFEKYLKNRGK